jgi:hypothetical protein
MEQQRLDEARQQGIPWKKWGPYLSERQWGTVREDYSPGGDAWSYFTHEQARSRAYRWGEDGLAGICDDQQQLCFALALWNGADPILKERAFGLSNSEGNHGEDVKEYYFYLDSTPTHSYMKYLYKYPQRAYPYTELVNVNRNRSRFEMEYELLDTGVFDENRYFDVFVEYAKNGPEDMLIQITAANRGPEVATLHVLPTLWFRNTWAWTRGAAKPVLKSLRGDQPAIVASHPVLGERYLYFQDGGELLFTENETNYQCLFGAPNASPYAKDGINDYVVSGHRDAVDPEGVGTKAAVRYEMRLEPGESRTICLRLNDMHPAALSGPPADLLGAGFDRIFTARRAEADEFYGQVIPESLPDDQRNVMRQALAGMLWSKQYYHYDVTDWLRGDPAGPPPGRQGQPRNQQWFHMLAADVISMPDKWEYPWFAAWDLAFHTYVLALVDADFAKEQLDLLTRGLYMHPNGQLPAYEWNFSDVNPPVQAWAVWRVYWLERLQRGKGDRAFLERSFDRLLMNFTWWINRKDEGGSNVFEGGFLGLDNIGVFDRNTPLPGGVRLEQADGTAWMALYSLDMLQMALELALDDENYEGLAANFYEHFIYIAAANSQRLWDDEEGFFYDQLRLSDGQVRRMEVHSLVGLLPICAVTLITPQMVQSLPHFTERVRQFNTKHPELVEQVYSPVEPGQNGLRLLTMFGSGRLIRVARRILDESEFLSPYGIRAVSAYHRDHPYMIQLAGQENRVDYMPAESTNNMFGGNSNWRGPIWFPINTLLIEGLLSYYAYVGDDVKVECPTGSGQMLTVFEVAKELGRRLSSIFLRQDGRRPVYGGMTKFQEDPYWRDYILFHEYFHGDNGAGLGASHQTGWTGLVASLIDFFGRNPNGAEWAQRAWFTLARERGREQAEAVAAK